MNRVRKPTHFNLNYEFIASSYLMELDVEQVVIFMNFDSGLQDPLTRIICFHMLERRSDMDANQYQKITSFFSMAIERSREIFEIIMITLLDEGKVKIL